MATPEVPMADPEDPNSMQSSSDPLTRGGSVNDKTGRDGDELPGLAESPAPATFNDRTGR
jgi:hypothetical protein